MLERLDPLGFGEEPHLYLWHACQWGKLDPAKSLRKWDTAWRALRDEAGRQRKALDQLDAMHTAEQSAKIEETPQQSEALPVTACGTSQFTSQAVWLGSLDPGKLSLPLIRRDVRVVEGARLESDFGDAYQATLKHLVALTVQQLTDTRCSSV